MRIFSILPTPSRIRTARFSSRSIQYDLSFDTNGAPLTLSTTFDFAHNETDNDASPCPAGDSQPCADIVTVSPVSFNQFITVGTDVFFFNLLGFSTNGGATIGSRFVSDENASNSAGLFAIVTLTPIPEPTTLALVGLALAGFGFSRRGWAVQRRISPESVSRVLSGLFTEPVPTGPTESRIVYQLSYLC